MKANNNTMRPSFNQTKNKINNKNNTAVLYHLTATNIAPKVHHSIKFITGNFKNSLTENTINIFKNIQNILKNIYRYF